MIQNTKAFVLSYLKYSDNSLIVKCYTEQFGFKSFIIKNSFSKKQKKNHYIFALNEIELSFYPKKNNSLELIKDIFQGYIFQQLPVEITKSSIISFISEVLHYTLQNEEEQNDILYNFIKSNLILLDNKEKYFADFHLYFLLELSRYIGFYPLKSNIEFPYFNLKEGVFSLKNTNITKEENAFLWNALLDYNFIDNKNCFSSMQRAKMLEEILSFYSLHIANFKQPLSLEVLKLVFS